MKSQLVDVASSWNNGVKGGTRHARLAVTINGNKSVSAMAELGQKEEDPVEILYYDQ